MAVGDQTCPPSLVFKKSLQDVEVNMVVGLVLHVSEKWQKPSARQERLLVRFS